MDGSIKYVYFNVDVSGWLLNRRYDGGKDAMVPQKDFTLRLRRELLGGRKLTKAVLHAPKDDPLAIPLTSNEQDVAVPIPELDLWAILELGGE